MAKLDFPDTPTVGQLYGSSGTVWRWDGARWASTAGASGAKGRVAYAQVTTPQGSITSEVAIAGLSVTWTADPARTYRISGHGEMYSSIAGDTGALLVKNGGTTLARSPSYVGGVNNAVAVDPVVVQSGLSGTQTRSLSAVRSGGTGTFTLYTDPAFPAFILVEDITYEAGTSGQPGPGVGGPRGVVALAKVTQSQGGIGAALVDLNGMTVNWVADSARTYKTTVFCTPSSTVVSDDVVLQITDAANNQIQGFSSPYLDPQSSSSISFTHVETGLTGPITRKVRIRSSVGTATNFAATTQMSYVLIEDITYDPGVTPTGLVTNPAEILGTLYNGNQGYVEMTPPNRMFIETGSNVSNLAGGGWGSFTFRKAPFPNPPIVIAIQGDYAGATPLMIATRDISTNGFAFVCCYHDGSSPAAGSPVRINYIAISYA